MCELSKLKLAEMLSVAGNSDDPCKPLPEIKLKGAFTWIDDYEKTDA